MKRNHSKMAAVMIAISLLIIPVGADALLFLNADSQPGNIILSGSLLIPFPFFTLSISEFSETDLFGVAQLMISGHDDSAKLNTLQVSMEPGDPFEIPVPYGSLGYNYLLFPGSMPPLGVDQSDIYWYLSVANGQADSTLSSNLNLSASIEREQLLDILAHTSPGMDLSELIGEGPFEVGLALAGEISGRATLSQPSISGEFNYSLTLPEDLFPAELPIEMPELSMEGKAKMEITFEWVTDALFNRVVLSTTLETLGEELPLDPIGFDLVPEGTSIFWFDLG